jgi:hypothetical protein
MSYEPIGFLSHTGGLEPTWEVPPTVNRARFNQSLLIQIEIIFRRTSRLTMTCLDLRYGLRASPGSHAALQAQRNWSRIYRHRGIGPGFTGTEELVPDLQAQRNWSRIYRHSLNHLRLNKPASDPNAVGSRFQEHAGNMPLTESHLDGQLLCRGRPK